MISDRDGIIWAQALIEELPKEHEGRNSWLLNYGRGDESDKLKIKNILSNAGTTPSEKIEAIHNIFKPKIVSNCQPAPQYPKPGIF